MKNPKTGSGENIGERSFILEESTRIEGQFGEKTRSGLIGGQERPIERGYLTNEENIRDKSICRGSSCVNECSICTSERERGGEVYTRLVVQCW